MLIIKKHLVTHLSRHSHTHLNLERGRETGGEKGRRGREREAERNLPQRRGEELSLHLAHYYIERVITLNYHYINH